MEDRNKVSFGEAFELIIKDQKLSKIEASKMIGKSNAAVSRLISDKTSPSIETALKTLEPFGYTIAIVKSDRKLNGKHFFLTNKTEDDE